MIRKNYKVTIPAALAVVMVAFLSSFFFVNANLSMADSVKQKQSSAVSRTSSVEYTDAQIKQLQYALKLTDSQEELWKNLTQVMRENAKDMDAFTKDRAGKAKTM